jgi:hypothetical protein
VGLIKDIQPAARIVQQLKQETEQVMGQSDRSTDRCASVIGRLEETVMKIVGACHCGNITYSAEIDPENVGICHCTDCQTLSGSAFRTSVRANKEAFHLEGGQPKIYVKTAESGAKRAQAFCPECGTSIYSAAVSDPQVFNIRVGTARQRAELRPKSQGWCRSARDWVMDLQSIKQFAKQRTS